MTSSPVDLALPIAAAEKLLLDKRFREAKQAAEFVLGDSPDARATLRALLVVAQSAAQLRLETEAEAAWRKLNALDPAQPQALFGLARAHHRARRHEQAGALLEGLLRSQPGNVDAVALLWEVLRALGRPADAEPWIAAAIERAPANPRLQLLRGEWLIHSGRADEGRARLRDALGKRPGNAGAWLALMREAEGRRSSDEALDLAAQAVAACPQNFWVWSRQLLMLAAAGRHAELAAELASRPAPPLENRDGFLQWVSLMQRLDEAPRVRTALEQADPAQRERFEATLEGARLRSELAREAGDAVEALCWMKQAEAIGPADAGLLHQLFNLCLLTGDTVLAEQTASRLHRMNPRNHGGLAMFQLHETRIFARAMARVREAVHGPAPERLAALGRIVLDEPGCVPVALAWLEVFIAERGKARPEPGACSVVPRQLHHVEDPSEAWQRGHEGFCWLDLREPQRFAAARSRLPPKGNRLLMSHPEATRLDLLRLSSLEELGGWWVPAATPCCGSVEWLAAPRASLVVHVTARGFLDPALVGCVPGHPAIREALAIALLALDEPPRGNSSMLTSGQPALSLGVAIACAKELVEQGSLPGDVAVVTPPQLNRWLAMPWPK